MLLTRTCRLLPVLFLFQISNAQERPAPELLTIDNGQIKIGMDRAMGASLTYLSWKGYSANTINSSDPGRLIQQSYYAGKRLDRTADGQHKAWSPWSWNPIQGGGVGSWARVTEFKHLDEKQALYAETIPKLWDMPNEEAEALMKQWTSFVPEMPNVVTVRCELISKRTPGDRWGPARKTPQEIPACYFTRNFDTFKTYQGGGKWETVTQPIGPPWGVTTTPRQAMACFEPSGQGVAIFSPAAESWNFGPHGSGKTTDPAAGPCVHFAPVGFIELGPQSTLSYRYWLITGTEAEIATRLETLWTKHQKETISISNPASTKDQ